MYTHNVLRDLNAAATVGNSTAKAHGTVTTTIGEDFFYLSLSLSFPVWCSV
jgi:hypothetical protein